MAKRIFFDTAPFIYWMETHSEYFPVVSGFIIGEMEMAAVLVTSVLTHHEFTVKPARNENFQLITDFENCLIEMPFEVISIDLNISKHSVQLRKKYVTMKAFDSVQIAAAIASNCDLFLTNDKELKSIYEIKVQLISEL
ncbi:MAG: type II toxin-antitoxin system VapC family toxin [Flavobacteriales bacterium]